MGPGSAIFCLASQHTQWLPLGHSKRLDPAMYQCEIATQHLPPIHSLCPFRRKPTVFRAMSVGLGEYDLHGNHLRRQLLISSQSDSEVQDDPASRHERLLKIPAIKDIGEDTDR